jgi:hypothetical protein
MNVVVDGATIAQWTWACRLLGMYRGDWDCDHEGWSGVDDGSVVCVLEEQFHID